MRWLPGRVGALVAQGRTQCDANANAKVVFADLVLLFIHSASP